MSDEVVIECYTFCECQAHGSFTDFAMRRRCGTIGIEHEGRTSRLACGHGGGKHFDTPRLRAAVIAARSYRFHGIW